MIARRFNPTWLALVLLFAPLSSRAGEVIDRIVATVNGHIVLQSDWDDEVCFEAFSAGRPLEQMGAFDRKAALDHLIDQELLREQLHSSELQHANSAEVEGRLKEIRNLYPAASSDEAWRNLLSRYNLTQDQLESRIGVQLDLMRLVDARLRPSVQIDSKSIESYYNRELLPQLRQAGAASVALADVSPKIKEVLTQQKVNELLTAWLQNLRAGSDIRLESEASASQNLSQ